eukprot:TRINITY_DN20542_c0_g1_i1.p1 TRINITY_DN20542_c0_g1~~TRINITY_DN20542_c0_g1_i1.p1  ORF type:complete len:148 (-),score=27.84 TRINITY_DN20542_c0_g1_i1:26-469(-)
MSLINTEVKPFAATAYHNGKFVPVTQEDLKGKWSVVFFYPADFTFVCPTELGDLADNYAEFQKLGVEIYGVSTDTHFTHKAWYDTCLLYTSDAADDMQCVDLGGRRIIKKKKKEQYQQKHTPKKKNEEHKIETDHILSLRMNKQNKK